MFRWCRRRADDTTGYFRSSPAGCETWRLRDAREKHERSHCMIERMRPQSQTRDTDAAEIAWSSIVIAMTDVVGPLPWSEWASWKKLGKLWPDSGTDFGILASAGYSPNFATPL